MKRTTLLKSVLLLCALIVGSSSAWAATKWMKTAPASLATGDIVVIVDITEAKAMGNDHGTSSAPAAVEVTLNANEDEITGEVAATIQWEVTKINSDYKFNVPETTDYLYCTNTNNGVRVGSNSNNVFTIYNNSGVDFLKNTGTSRYTGHNTANGGDDWRCYTTINTNINNSVTAFFKKVEESSSPLASIGLSGEYPTEFTEGDEFSSEGLVVTATYEDSSSKTVTPTSITGYNMSTLDEYQTVTVSYTESEVTKTAIYTIIVNSLPTHTATFSVNGETTSEDFKEGADIEFPSTPADKGGKKFAGWSTTTIAGTTDDEPTFVTSAKMGTSDVTYYAVFASGSKVSTPQSLEITRSTEGVPSAYGTANAFDECEILGFTFQIQQMYGTGTGDGAKLQWRAAGNGNGTGTMYNSDPITKIQSVVLTYHSTDTGKNFTLSIGDSDNPTSGTSITPTNSGNVYTYDCSAYNYDYFVLTNGANAGYLTKLTINYLEESGSFSAYCTTVTATTPAVTSAGWATYIAEYNMQFEEGDAFAVTSVDTKVNLESVTQVNVGEPLLLKGEGAKTARVLNAAPGDISNLLAISDGTNGGNGDYVLYKDATNPVGFYKWNGGLLDANKVYLPADNVPSTAREFLLFDDGETTAISEVSGKSADVRGEYYNLNGQRIAQPTKGLYIVNGKKVIIK